MHGSELLHLCAFLHGLVLILFLVCFQLLVDLAYLGFGIIEDRGRTLRLDLALSRLFEPSRLEYFAAPDRSF